MEERMSVWFDKRGDYLEINIGKPKKGYFEPIDGTDAYIRIDSRTGKVIGFAFLNFSKMFNSSHAEFKLPASIKF